MDFLDTQVDYVHKIKLCDSEIDIEKELREKRRN